MIVYQNLYIGHWYLKCCIDLFSLSWEPQNFQCYPCHDDSIRSRIRVKNGLPALKSIKCDLFALVAGQWEALSQSAPNLKMIEITLSRKDRLDEKRIAAIASIRTVEELTIPVYGVRSLYPLEKATHLKILRLITPDGVVPTKLPTVTHVDGAWEANSRHFTTNMRTLESYPKLQTIRFGSRFWLGRERIPESIASRIVHLSLREHNSNTLSLLTNFKALHVSVESFNLPFPPNVETAKAITSFPKLKSIAWSHSTYNETMACNVYSPTYKVSPSYDAYMESLPQRFLEAVTSFDVQTYEDNVASQKFRILRFLPNLESFNAGCIRISDLKLWNQEGVQLPVNVRAMKLQLTRDQSGDSFIQTITEQDIAEFPTFPSVRIATLTGIEENPMGLVVQRLFPNARELRLTSGPEEDRLWVQELNGLQHCHKIISLSTDCYMPSIPSEFDMLKEYLPPNLKVLDLSFSNNVINAPGPGEDGWFAALKHLPLERIFFPPQMWIDRPSAPGLRELALKRHVSIYWTFNEHWDGTPDHSLSWMWEYASYEDLYPELQEQMYFASNGR